MEMYQRLCVEYYDLDKPHPPEEAYAFYLKHVEKASVTLEPMSGSGRFMLPLMQAGHAVTGVDASPSMVQALETQAARLGVEPRIHKQSLETLQLESTYDLIIIPSGSLGLITDEAALRQSLSRLYRHLSDGGSFVFEVSTLKEIPDTFGATFGGVQDKDNGDKIVFTGFYASFDENTSVLRSIHRYEHFQHGKLLDSELEDFQVRLFDQATITRLLEETGFTEVVLAEDYKGTPASTESKELVVTCKK
ncbi:class I SAM-dependent methyltransferase [Paenalkalicoccus suaedae]|uniref:Class I SAM-dependent methyltransferase n=1 Tax=Paenalkalicoccus suaedae TaxID=2592382 RepID=A0A859FCR8_9BACI|nr:class I SAM-dependent methyltransferase [Paenalkalicoccus suaedae]QKS70055.1 class I SAM-dependent methyltransferase [Paenalkalicoccus suaedae]